MEETPSSEVTLGQLRVFALAHDKHYDHDGYEDSWLAIPYYGVFFFSALGGRQRAWCRRSGEWVNENLYYLAPGC